MVSFDQPAGSLSAALGAYPGVVVGAALPQKVAVVGFLGWFCASDMMQVPDDQPAAQLHEPSPGQSSATAG